MTSTRRPTFPPSSNPSPPLAPAAIADAQATHESGSPETSGYAPSVRRGPSDPPPAATPTSPAAPRPSRTISRGLPPALPADASLIPPMTLESLHAWATAPGQSKYERAERAELAAQLTGRTPAGARGIRKIGDLDLRFNKNLTSLPKGLSVSGNLLLAGCSALAQLPEGLSVGGRINLSDCTALTQLPKGLSVGGRINLSDCTALTHLPEGLSIRGDLMMARCTALTQLPESLAIGGSLFILACTALTQLPKKLSVGAYLELSGCTALAQLPQELSVGDDVFLCDCTALTQLPEGILQWPLKSNGQPHLIDVAGSGINGERLVTLRRVVGAGVQLVENVLT
jgi:hypothetical protein